MSRARQKPLNLFAWFLDAAICYELFELLNQHQPENDLDLRKVERFGGVELSLAKQRRSLSSHPRLTPSGLLHVIPLIIANGMDGGCPHRPFSYSWQAMIAGGLAGISLVLIR